MSVFYVILSFLQHENYKTTITADWLKQLKIVPVNPEFLTIIPESPTQGIKKEY